jgi:hypothetical protein
MALISFNAGKAYIDILGHAVELAELFERVRASTKEARANISNVDALVKVANEVHEGYTREH